MVNKIFGPKRDGVMGGWRKLHNEELRDLCSSPIIIRIIKSKMMRWAEHVARMGERRNVYSLLTGKPEGKILLTPWPLVRERTIPTDRPPLADEILVSTFVDGGVSRGQRGGSPKVKLSP
jgi:hypothetical protein